MPLSQIGAAALDGAQNGSAPIYGARAWVNFNGTGTVAIRASGNVSSITDNGVGDYTVNITNAITDINYSVSGMCQRTDGASNAYFITLKAQVTTLSLTTTTIRIQTGLSAASGVAAEALGDCGIVSIAVFR